MKQTINWSVFLLVIILMLACKKDNKSSEKEILSFTLSEQTGEAVIDKTNHIVLLQVKLGTDLSLLSPEIELSADASSVPASGQTTDFSQGTVSYTVIAEDKSSQEWKVTVEAEKSSAAQILSFTVESQTIETKLTDSTVYLTLPKGTDLTIVKPQILVSPGATINPASGVAVDFSQGSAIYAVTAADNTIKHWTVTVENAKSMAANIITFTVPAQIGASVINNNKILVEVPYGTDFSKIKPEISISDFATISPANGTTVDFSNGSVQYVVTSEKGNVQNFSVDVVPSLIAADNINIQYTGRIDFTNPKKPKFWNPGIYAKAKYTGTFCVVAVNDQLLWGSSKNYMEIVIDDTLRVHVQSASGVNNFRVGNNLPYGEHTVLLCKDTEAGIGYIEFLGIRAESLVALPAKPAKRIEFIGNSITCGSGIDISKYACGKGEWYGQHNAYMSYGPRVARALDAQWMLTSVSGIGLIQSCCGMTNKMPLVYDKVDLNLVNTAVWDFSNYVADAVTICLGQNDGIQDSTLFCTAYVNFISTVRSKYANAAIICLTSPMANNTLEASQKKYLTSIVAKVNSDGDNKVYFLELSHNLNLGCSSHPNMAQHGQIADEIVTFFKNTLGW